MKNEAGGGKYLTPSDRKAMRQEKRGRARPGPRRYLTVTVLLLWDGLLLYMILQCLIDGVYGAVFVAVISIYLGYHLK